MKLLTKKIGILGYGREAKALKTFLENRHVRDLKVFDEFLEEHPGFDEIEDRDVLFRSSGVSPDHPALQNFRGKVMSGTELFFQLCPTKKAIGITGTQGKSTSAQLLSRMFEEANDIVYFLGNAGAPFFESLPNIRTRDVVVSELNSFQLWDSEQSPQIAVLLRLEDDHLDVHKDSDEYLLAKKNIFANQKSGGRVVYCADCKKVNKLVEDLEEEVLFPFSAKKKLQKGAFLREGKIIWKQGDEEEELVDLEEIKITGKWNLENILGALAAAKLLNVRDIPLQTALQKFTNLPYRFELKAATRNGTKFWNNAYATTPMATIAALEEFDESLVLVAGGKSKKLNYKNLGEAIDKKENLKSIILFGDTAEEIKSAIKGKKNITVVKTFKDVFDALKKEAEKGDTVLLSPSAGLKDVEKTGEQWDAKITEMLKDF